MNYRYVYEQLINKRKVTIPTGYGEVHHIIPRSLGGADTKENLVKLTAREHFVAHLLLTRIYKDDISAYSKMVKAFFMMLIESTNQQRHITSKTYEKLRITFAKIQSCSQSGTGNSQHGTMWIHNIELQTSKKIAKIDGLPEGWYKGRIVSFDKVADRKVATDSKLASKQHKKDALVKKYSEYYLLYSKVGFIQFVEDTGYQFSQQNLVMRFNKLVKEFLPQNGKKRSIPREPPGVATDC